MTFMNQYLKNILDQRLSSMAIVHELSTGLGQTLGYMQSVNYLLDFTALSSQIPEGRILHGIWVQASNLRHSGRADWWVKQEMPKIHETVSKFFRIPQKLPVNSQTMPTSD
ncbi:hypothetical protein BU16DRAFT_557421 [Lophium mytilinum]|uniref:Uncharacterized protein n=1 Tax=Lophium mytilinum TaxID=390894 RepID=A0A6A6R585_9PEZI|nr:hypothetical protein BU16DRAFT_557421 [Lophium mytilinum]